MSSWEVLLLMLVCYCATSHDHIHQALKSSVFPHKWLCVMFNSVVCRHCNPKSGMWLIEKVLFWSLRFLLYFESHRMMCAFNFRFGAVWSEYTNQTIPFVFRPELLKKHPCTSEGQPHILRHGLWNHDWARLSIYLCSAFYTGRSHLLDFCFGVCSGPGLLHGC